MAKTHAPFCTASQTKSSSGKMRVTGGSHRVLDFMWAKHVLHTREMLRVSYGAVSPYDSDSSSSDMSHFTLEVFAAVSSRFRLSLM